MFGSLGLPELVMIFLVALLLFGPRKLPEIGRTVGKALGEFRRASNDLKRTLEDEVAADELRDVGRDLRTTMQEPTGDIAQDAVAPPPNPTPGEAAPEGAPRDAQTPPEPAVANPPSTAVNQEPS